MTIKIPEISRERIEELLTKIRPLVRSSSNSLELYTTDIGDEYFKHSFNFARIPIDKVEPGTLTVIDTVLTYHTCGYHAMAKPSIAEVFAQIPEHLLEHVTAFEVRAGDDSTEYVDRENFYGHRFVTILYGTSN